MQDYLRDLGHSVQIIDYRPDYLRGHYNLFGVSNPKYDKPIIRECYQLAKLPGRVLKRYGKRKRAFDRFTGEYLELTEKQYLSTEDLFSDRPQADLFLAGSDQIWNTILPNGRDPSFYLQFADESSVRASYAASFASDSVDSKYEREVFSWLKSLTAISVREKTGLDILQKAGITNGVVVLDPVFLLPQSHWISLCRQIKVDEPYLLIYDFDQNAQIKVWAEELSKRYGWSIYSIQNLPYSRKRFTNCGPLEFLSLIRNAGFILSNSFHATAFSVIFQKEFLTFNRNIAINSRMADFLASLRLEDRMVGMGSNFKVPDSIDYQTVLKELERQSAQSKNYLNSVISMVEKRNGGSRPD